jgi:2,4-dienoyl-CoA reductase-like NADH-dependent reductase (Old Yellow Enzyme family)
MRTTTRRLFAPVNLEAMELGHRVVMAPLPRSRSTLPDNVPNDLMAEHYSRCAASADMSGHDVSSVVTSLRTLTANGLTIGGDRRRIANLGASRKKFDRAS